MARSHPKSLNPQQLANAPLRAGLLLIAGEVAEARALCEQVLVEAPADWPRRLDALQVLARLARRQHDWPRALEALNEVLARVPDDAAAWYQRGLVHRSRAAWAAALADMEQAVARCVDPAQRAHYAQGLAVTRQEARAAERASHHGRKTPRR